jgi:hypothetical protein
VRPRVLLFAALLLVPRAASADENDRPLAQQLFDDGRTLLEAGRYAEACPKFAESQRLDPGGGTLLNLAYCHELEGKTATAWSEFHDALTQATKDDRKDRETFARQHIADIEPRLVRILVHVPGRIAARDPEIVLDRSKLPPAAWETPIPVDPGEHHVNVVVKGAMPWTTSIDATHPGETYSVAVPTFETPLVCPAGEIRVEEQCVAIPWDTEKPKRSTAFWLVLGGAGLLLVTSAVTGVIAMDANAYVNDNCSTNRDYCRVPDAADAATRAKTFAWVSTITLGAALAAGGVAFLLPRERPPSRGGGRIDVGLGSVRLTGW